MSSFILANFGHSESKEAPDLKRLMSAGFTEKGKLRLSAKARDISFRNATSVTYSLPSGPKRHRLLWQVYLVVELIKKPEQIKRQLR